MFDWIVKGGPVMIPILLGSVVGLAIVFERGYLWWRLRLDAQRLTDDVLQLVRSDRSAEARQRCAATAHPVARVLRVGLSHTEQELPDIERLMQQEGERVVQELERHLGGLSSLVTIEPLLGFLGTITGLIRSFRAWEHAGAEVTVSALAAGIYEAMLTTAVGLSVAIPLFLAYQHFMHRTKRLAFEMTDSGNALLQALSATTRSSHARSTVA